MSPLCAKPLRQAGAGVEDMIIKLRRRFIERLGSEFGAVCFGVGIMAGALIPWGIPAYILGLFIACAALWRMKQTDKLADKLDFMRMGKEGEVAVAEALSVLERKHGARVFHDVDTSKGWIDHVIVHASGVYAVETKAMSRHNEGYTSLRFDGETVWNGKFECVQDAPRQALRQAVALRDYIRDESAILLRTRAVLLLPGWDVEQAGANPNLRVDSPQGFVRAFDYGAQNLSVDEQKRIVQAIVRKQRAAVAA